MDENTKTFGRNQIAILIRNSFNVILNLWETRARKEIKAAEGIDKLSLIDSMPEFLKELADFLDSAEEASQTQNVAEIATIHGEQRASLEKYTLEQVISEYQILRDVLFKFLEEYQNRPVAVEVRESITFFVDNGVREAAVRFTARSESETARSRKELFSFIMQSPAPMVIIVGDNFQFALANPAYERLVGRKVMGKTVLQAFTEEEVGRFIPLLSDVYKTGTPYIGKELPLNIHDEHGQIEDRFVNLRYFPFRDEHGKIIGVIADMQDVTELVLSRRRVEKNKIELEQEKFKLESIFQLSPAAMAIWRGPDFIFEKVNPEYQKLFGTRALVGRPLLEALPELKNQPFAELIKDVLQTGTPYLGKETLAQISKTDEGPVEDHYFDFAYLRLNDSEGNPYGVYDHAIDVTERVFAQAELKKAMEDLKQAKNDAERANSLKSSFLANMSHEIRTPLGAIIGFTDLLKDNRLHTNERRQYLETISRNGKALTRIIDDILDLAKVESGKLEMEKVEFSFHQLIDDVMDIFRERTKSKGIYLRSNIADDVPVKIVCDPTRLRQILINIVGNAVKFTQTGGVTISVRAAFMESEKVKITITVKDTGIGLTQEQQEKLFEPFMQADNSTTRKFGGTGLGLALSNRLANALGGQIAIENCKPNKGCTFNITLTADLPPIAKTSRVTEDKESARYTHENTTHPENLRILVADDALDNQDLVRILLQRYGYTVEAAKDGLEAVRMAQKGDFDVILMDIQMPVMDGYEATRQLRESGYTRPIIALTAHAMPEERAKTMAAGCNGHLTKPLDRLELLRTIQFYASGDQRRDRYLEQ